jgi:hypothetical protein
MATFAQLRQGASAPSERDVARSAQHAEQVTDRPDTSPSQRVARSGSVRSRHRDADANDYRA